MSQLEVLKTVVGVLDEMGVPYTATGSIVSSLQGEPRLSHDIDLVVLMERDDAPVLARAFPPPDYYLDEISIREAIGTRGMFNLAYHPTGDKVDFWLLGYEPFDRSLFHRRFPHPIADFMLMVTRPEDTILQKLRWVVKYGAGEKQLVDVRGILDVQGKTLDLTYIEQWLDPLKVRDLWRQLLAERE